MVSVEQLAAKPKDFVRTTGINYITFKLVLERVSDYIAQDKEQHPISKRGRKSSHSLEQMLLLSLMYMRQYHSFLCLGQAFSISESYAYKRYCYIRGILMQVLDMPAQGLLARASVDKLAIDVSEQAIERPVKEQKQYYSGKKKAHDKSLVSGLPVDGHDLGSGL